MTKRVAKDCPSGFLKFWFFVGKMIFEKCSTWESQDPDFRRPLHVWPSTVARQAIPLGIRAERARTELSRDPARLARRPEAAGTQQISLLSIPGTYGTFAAGFTGGLRVENTRKSWKSIKFLQNPRLARPSISNNPVPHCSDILWHALQVGGGGLRKYLQRKKEVLF